MARTERRGSRPTGDAAQRENSEFAQIKHELDAYAKSHGFSSSVQTSIEQRGLVIKVLTDDLLFPSGQATLDAESYALLGEIGQLLNIDETHPISVEGNTDNVPIHSAQFSSNWELSTARASAVVEFLAEHGVARAQADSERQRRPAAGGQQRDRRRARAQPARGDRDAPHLRRRRKRKQP